MNELLCMKEYFAKTGIELSDLQAKQFLDYYQILVETNKVMNLTAITDFEEVVIKHFADSAALLSYYEPIKGKVSLIDVGTGAGFPGIPLKIMNPNLNIVLLDSLNKRIKFLDQVIDLLGFDKNTIKTVHSRAEDAGRNKEYREKFDYCVSRAVANLSSLSEYCLPFVKKGGCFISYKSLSSTSELADAEYAIKQLSGKVTDNIEFMLPDTDITRNFIIIQKTAPMNKIYPRKAGTPTKEPLTKK